MCKMIFVFRLVLAAVGAGLLVLAGGCDEGPDPLLRTSNEPNPARSEAPAESPPSVEAVSESEKRSVTNEGRPSPGMANVQRGQDVAAAGTKADTLQPSSRNGNPSGQQTAGQPPARVASAGQAGAGHGPAHAVGAPSGSAMNGRQALPVKLSAGVALPQSLPTGTTMGFSVDYVFVAGQPASSMKTVWVIEMAKRGPAEIPVQLRLRGNLSAFVPGVKPQHGPFQCYLAVVSTGGQRRPISPKIAMR